MASPTFSEEGELRVEYERRNAPRLSDHITRRGHVGPVPLPSESVYIPAPPAHTSPPRATQYQTPGNAPIPGMWPTSAHANPAQPTTTWYPEPHTATDMSAHSQRPSIHLSQADFASTPARSLPHPATMANSPRPYPLATPQDCAREAWKIFVELGEQEGAVVPDDPMDAADAVIGWLRYFASSLKTGRIWTRHTRFYNDLGRMRAFADLLRASRDMGDNNYLEYDYDLTDLVSRAERAGQTPLHQIMSEGVPITPLDHAPV
ncbi:uncharacterized protein SCHCODRAFT_02477124, partial [Schizophyllum commune H4-8]|uniref:uncharacterized protein n=1 Tax=Schizophyllum commune (strain H4-8 / FGSC 9210) TaxID=578458 RepID=UPI00215EF753